MKEGKGKRLGGYPDVLNGAEFKVRFDGESRLIKKEVVLGPFQRRWGRTVLLLPAGYKLTLSSKEAGIMRYRNKHLPFPDNVWMSFVSDQDSSWFSWAYINNIPAWSLGQPYSEMIK